MDYHSLYQKSVLELRKIAKENRVRVPAGTSKAMIVQLILEGVEHEGDTSVVKPKSIDQEVRRASMGRPGRPPMKKGSVQRGPTAAEIEQGILSVKRPEVMPEERPAVRSSYAMRRNQSANGERLYEDYESGSESWDGESDDLYAAGVVTPSAEAPQPEPPAPRKRGRPRKVREESPEPPVPVVKRPRGRPRRTPLPEAAVANPEAAAPQENAPAQSIAALQTVPLPEEANKAPVQPNAEAAAKANSVETPVETKTETSAETNAETPVEIKEKASAESNAEVPAEKKVEPHVETNTETHAEINTEAPVEANAEASTNQNVDAPAKPAAEASTNQSTEAPAKPAVEAPVHQSTEVTTKPAAETPSSNSAQNTAQPGRGYVRRSFGNGDTYRPAVLNGNAANRQPTPADGVRRPSLPRQRFENARYNQDQRAENSRYSSERRAETPRSNYNDQRTENPRYNPEQRAETPRSSYNDQRAETPRSNSDRREDATAQSFDLVYRDDPVQRTLQAQRAANYENGLRRMENESFNPQSAEFADGAGLLEIQPDGYGFLRAENCLPGSKDVYISIAQIRRFGLRPGDFVEGKTRPQREGDRYSALVYINRVNGGSPELAAQRKPFEALVPWYPTERLRMENPLKPDISMRMIDIVAPIGKGQRGMIVSQPKAGKTTLLKKIANSIADNNPEVKLIVLLIDERPEEVTDMKRSIRGDVIYSTFDSAPENHARVSEMVLAHAQRLVESGKDVVILLDSITRLARAYNLTIPPTGRSLSGGLDPGALYKPKKFFGAARNIENGGSLTIIATALVETGSRMDDIIFEEFKGTGNMELHLDRRLSDKRIFPAIDLLKSGTRREELLLKPEEREGEYQVRRMLTAGGSQQSTEQLISLMEKTTNNVDFFRRLKGWMAVYEKEGFTLGGKSDRG
ncbi:MAG: transcription termination factor Rho [Candidatus Faecivicinus sp.]|nr:transcription termination factor Rho [Candidatus Faecivicinus sp.]